MSILGVIQKPLFRASDGTIYYDSVISLEKINDKEYQLSMTLGENSEKKAGIAFLSFELRREKQPDNCLYSYLPDLQYAYLSNYSVIGCSPDYGKGRMMIRYKFAELFHLQSNQIIHATYSTYSLTQNNPQLEMVTVLDEWCSLTGNWHNYYQTGKPPSGWKILVIDWILT